MRTIKLLFGLFFIAILSISAQDTDASNKVGVYLEHNGTLLQYEYAYDQLLQMLGKQFPETTANATGWEYLRKNRKDAIEGIKQALIPIYQKNFTSSEIKEMTTFYQSEAGVQLLKDRTKMTADQKEALNRFYTSALGEKIIKKQSVLSKEVSAASENWSRDLYETAMSLLKN